MNPAHLSLGTVQTNMDDMYRKGRWQRARRTGLTEADAVCIRHLILHRGQTYAAVAALFETNIPAIYRVMRGTARLAA